jgi:Zn-dependent membrane protease YugP
MFIWILIFVITLVLSLGSQWYLKRTFAKASQIPVASGLNGEQAAARILQWAGITDVQIVAGDSFLGDHYDPLNKKLVLSPDNYSGTSAANVGVAAHECGHALQHQHHYFPLQIRMGSVYATHYASLIVTYLPLIAIFLHLISPYVYISLMTASLGVIMLFNLITLPVEFDASARANVVLQQHGIVRPGPEAEAVNSTLNAAGLTYVAAFIGILLQFLYYLMIFLGQRRN